MVVGGAGFVMQQDKFRRYFDIPVTSSKKGWHEAWFLIENILPKIQCHTGARHVVRDCWTDLLDV